jgi:translation initiation factor IF-2
MEVQKQPVVVILGHIDAGKTSLLNAIFEIEFKEEKPGGEITQHLGAFEVEKDRKKITFLDTPGHEAFSQMRSRGAKVADIAVLVVDSVEGVKEQTKEAIKCVEEAKIPLIVAIHKIDKPEANPERVKRELAKEGVLVESFGGKVPEVKTSAKTKEGIKDLLDLILLVAEMENLKADISRPAKGVIVESFLDSKRGPTATVILEEGILKRGDFLATKSTFGKVRILENPQKKKIEKIFPGQAGIIVGFEEVPTIGEEFFVFEDLEKAREYTRPVERKIEEIEVKEGQKILNLILKADALGTKEAIEQVLSNLKSEKVALKILRSGVGQINEEDVKFAKTAKATILGFRVKAEKPALDLAMRQKVRILNFQLIYDLIEEARKIMEEVVEPEIIRIDIGKVRVLVEFWKKGERQIIGGRVIEGEVQNGLFLEIVRDGEVIGEGKILNLQKEKRDIQFAKKGEEIGILYEGKERIKEGDVLNIFKKEKKKVEI